MKNHLTESELYQQLGALTKKRDEWEASMPYTTIKALRSVMHHAVLRSVIDVPIKS